METVFWLFCALNFSLAIGKKQYGNFQEDKARSNYVFSDSLFKIATSSLSTCAAKCNKVSKCYGFSLNMDKNDCRGYSRFARPSSNRGTRVWKKALRCHSHYIYYPPMDLCWTWYEPYTWEGGNIYCSEEDGRLVSFQTMAKLLYIKQYLNGPGGPSGTRYYWIGGKLVAGTWKWLDGSVVNMDPSFWGPGEPRAYPTDIVIGMHLGTHGLFDDSMGLVPSKVICEKP